jgi:hypothetical protein
LLLHRIPAAPQLARGSRQRNERRCAQRGTHRECRGRWSSATEERSSGNECTRQCAQHARQACAAA